MLLAIIIPISIFLHLMVAGAAFCPLRNYFFNGPPDMYSDDATALSVVISLLWPLAFPIFLGMKTPIFASNRLSKNAKEIQQAEHKLQLAKINAETITYQEMEAGLR